MSIAANLYLIDTSAWARMRAPIVKKRLTAILQAAAAATCLPLDLEDGRSARNLRDAMTIRARRAEIMTDLPITTAVATRSWVACWMPRATTVAPSAVPAKGRTLR